MSGPPRPETVDQVFELLDLERVVEQLEDLDADEVAPLEDERGNRLSTPEAAELAALELAADRSRRDELLGAVRELLIAGRAAGAFLELYLDQAPAVQPGPAPRRAYAWLLEAIARVERCLE